MPHHPVYLPCHSHTRQLCLKSWCVLLVFLGVPSAPTETHRCFLHPHTGLLFYTHPHMQAQSTQPAPFLLCYSLLPRCLACCTVAFLPLPGPSCLESPGRMALKWQRWQCLCAPGRAKIIAGPGRVTWGLCSTKCWHRDTWAFLGYIALQAELLVTMRRAGLFGLGFRGYRLFFSNGWFVSYCYSRSANI